MDKNEYAKLQSMDSLVQLSDLSDQSERTLIYGYTCDRSTFHVYIRHNRIFVIVYKTGEEAREINVSTNNDYIPDKRIYPEACDYEFCKRLVEAGCNLPFTAWDDDRKVEPYYGRVILDGGAL